VTTKVENFGAARTEADAAVPGFFHYRGSRDQPDDASFVVALELVLFGPTSGTHTLRGETRWSAIAYRSDSQGTARTR